jgi:hypothetical protein
MLALGLILGITLAAPLELSGVAASESDGRDGRNGRNGNDGGSETVHDVGNVSEDESCSVIIGNITTGDEFGDTVTVNGSTGDPISVDGSVQGTGVIIFAPGVSSTAGTVDGNTDTGVTVAPCGDGSGGDDTTSTGDGVDP